MSIRRLPRRGRPFAGAAAGLAAALVIPNAAAFAATTPSGASSGSILTVCIDRSDPAAAMERRVAAAVAKIEGAALSVHEFDGSGNGDDDGFALKEFHKLASSECDLVMGFPVDTTSHEVPAGLMATDSYARVGFILVTQRSGRGSSLATLPRGTDVAVTYLTTPNLYFEKHPNVEADVHANDIETMQTLLDNKAQAAMVWRPTYTSYLAAHPNDHRFVTHPLTEPHEQFAVVALYGPRGAPAAGAFNDAVQQLRHRHQLDDLLAPFAVSHADVPPSLQAPGSFASFAADVQPADGQARVILAAAAMPMSPRFESDGSIRSVADAAPPALYTADQAKAGETKFAVNCAVCHGADLTGLAGPALKGKNFASVKADFSVGDVFTIVSQNMPATNPGSLAHDDYVDVMAFLLQQNGYPAGATKLTYNTATTSKVSLIYHGD